jgi:hypothetical protein
VALATVRDERCADGERAHADLRSSHRENYGLPSLDVL